MGVCVAVPVLVPEVDGVLDPVGVCVGVCVEVPVRVPVDEGVLLAVGV